MAILAKKELSSTFLVLLDQAVFSGTNFLLTLFLARQLDIKNFGLYSTVLIFTYLVMSLLNAIITQPFQVTIGKILKPNPYYSSLFLGLLLLLFSFTIITKSVGFILKDIFIYFHFINSIICFVFGYLFQDFFRKFFLAIGKVKSTFYIDVFFLSLLIGFFYIYKNNLTLNSILWIIGISNIISAIFGIIFIISIFEKPVQWKEYLREHFLQGKWLLSVATLQWCASNFFVLISGIYLGIEALGALRLVQSIFGIINVGLQTVENYFLPKVAFLYNDCKRNAKKYLWQLTGLGAIFFGVLLTFLFVFSEKIIILAGGIQYKNYAYVVKLIAILYFFIFLSYPIRIAIRVLVLNKIFFFGYLFSFLTSLLTFHFLLKYGSLYGAVTGLILNQIIMIVYWQNQLKKNNFLLWK